MRPATVIFLILLGASIGIIGPIAATRSYRWNGRAGAERLASVQSAVTDAGPFATSAQGDVFVGGQNGTWFQQGQFPRLSQLSLQNETYVQLHPVRSEGTVWGGGYNGSQLLVSGWGSDDGSPGPYVWLYNGAQVVTEGSLDEYGQASTWSGGDVFAASYNGYEWLLSGLGSGVLPTYSDDAINHMGLGTFNGSVFTDLSSLVPEQQDAILYTNAWNGQYWLVGGGGPSDNGVLFTFDGKNVHDLTPLAENAIASFGSVQSIAWNGSYWLIGGVGFLAEFDGTTFTDLTQRLTSQLGTNNSTVNAIAWNGQTWMLGGGTPIVQLTTGHAWIASYNSTSLVDLASALPSYMANETQTSSILSIAVSNGMWILGGYSGDQGVLLAYHGGFLTDDSNLVSGFTYVDWVSGLQDISF